jgi:hypothetical protein
VCSIPNYPRDRSGRVTTHVGPESYRLSPQPNGDPKTNDNENSETKEDPRLDNQDDPRNSDVPSPPPIVRRPPQMIISPT